jgi:hypothetical protein
MKTSVFCVPSATELDLIHDPAQDELHHAPQYRKHVVFYA